MAITSGILLDTHAWLWQQNNELKHSEELQDRLERAAAADTIFLCAISLYELVNGVQKGRIDLRPDAAEWFRVAFRGRSVRILDVTPAIALATLNLPSSFHGDPGDRLIAATAIVEDLTLLTHDRALLRFGKQGLMKTAKVDQKRGPHA